MNATRILLVDDDPGIVRLFSKALRSAGFDIYKAATGQQGLQLARESRPDLVLLDVRLPDLSGIEVCRRIKSDPVLRDVFVVFISGTAMSDPDRGQGWEAGADDYLLKPTESDELVARIRTMARLQKATAALRASEEHYRSLVEILPDAVGLIDPQGKVLAANPQAATLLGYANPADLLGKSVFELAPTEAQERIRANLAATLRTGTIRNIQYTLSDKSGRRFPVEFSATVLTDAKSQPLGLVAVGRDITERKKAEKQINAFSVLGHRLSATTTPEQAASIILDIASELFGWDAGYVHLYSPTEDKLIPVLTVDTVDGQRTSGSATFSLDPSPMMRLVMREGPQLIHRKNGSAPPVDLVPFGDTNRLSLSLMFVPIHSGGAVVGLLSIQSYTAQVYSQDDLALLQAMADHCGASLQRIEVAEALRIAELKYRSIFENATEGIFQTTPEGHFLSANLALARMLGYESPEELIASVTDLKRQLHVIPERRTEFTCLMETQGAVTGFEAQLYRKDGSKIWININAHVVRDPQGNILFYEGTNQEITIRKQAEELLHHSEERFRQVVENIREVFWMTDPKKNEMLYISPVYQEIWGRSCANLYASPRDWVKAIHPEDRERVLDAALRKQVSGEYHEVYRIVRPDGTIRWIEDRAFPVRNQAGEVYRITGIAEDITARKALSEEILRISEREQQRFGQDIHDGLCQNLAAVKFKAMLLETKLAEQSSPEAPGANAVAELLSQAIQEAYDLAKGLQPVKLEAEGLQAALEELAAGTRSRFDVQCRFRFRKHFVIGDPSVRIHLYRIAQEAVSNAIKHGRASRLWIALVAQNGRVALSVKDNGVGFSALSSQGTGMGLNIMNYRAQTIGATLDIRTRLNAGTRVACSLSLPEQSNLNPEQS